MSDHEHVDYYPYEDGDWNEERIDKLECLVRDLTERLNAHIGKDADKKEDA